MGHPVMYMHGTFEWLMPWHAKVDGVPRCMPPELTSRLVASDCSLTPTSALRRYAMITTLHHIACMRWRIGCVYLPVLPQNIGCVFYTVYHMTMSPNVLVVQWSTFGRVTLSAEQALVLHVQILACDI